VSRSKKLVASLLSLTAGIFLYSESALREEVEKCQSTVGFDLGTTRIRGQDVNHSAEATD